VRRRAFIAALGGAAALPFAARAQQAMPVVGLLRSTSSADSATFVSAFREGLKELGFVEGQNVSIEYRYADNQVDRLPALVGELIRRRAAVIAGNVNSALAAKVITATVPIIFATGGDPVEDGLVANLNRPGGNITGVVFFSGVLGAKRLEMLRQFVSKTTIIGVLVNPSRPDTEAERRDVQAAAQAIGQQLVIVDVNNDRDIEAAFATFVERRVGALLVGAGAFMSSNRERLATLAARHAIPTIYALREAATAGGLMSYASSIPDAYRQAGIYAGRVLKGEKPGDLPVMQATKFELVINLKTAKALGLEFHPQLLGLADEVIE
jgi:putative ABC transport system substrate-binding protein